MENREWKEYILSDVIDKFIDYRGRTPKKTDFGIPLITAKVVKNGRLLEPNEFIAEEDYEDWMTRGFPKFNDVILTSEAPLGEVALVKDEKIALAQRIITLQTNKDICNSIFLKYYFQSYIGQNALQSRASGSTVEGIKSAELKKVEIQLPPLPEQKAIASVLSSLDDKIDLLHQQNQTLEALAETLFRQWFIEEAKEDWEERPLSFFGKIICGKTPSKKQSSFFNGIYPFIKIPDMHGKTYVFETSDTLTEEGLKSQFNKTIPEKSINVSCIATVGLVTMNAYTSQTNQQINSIIPIDVFRYYIYCQMKNSFELLQAMASGGTATPNLNTGDFSKISIPNPDTEILKKFNIEVSPIFDKIFENSKQIQTLTQLRDTLLPKLMSGEVKVKM